MTVSVRMTVRNGIVGDRVRQLVCHLLGHVVVRVGRQDDVSEARDGRRRGDVKRRRGTVERDRHRLQRIALETGQLLVTVLDE